MLLNLPMKARRRLILIAFPVAALLAGGSVVFISPMLLFGLLLVEITLLMLLQKPSWLIWLSLFGGGISLNTINRGERIMLPVVGGVNLDGFRLLAFFVGLMLIGVSHRFLTRRFNLWPYLLFIGWAATTLTRSTVPGDGITMLVRLIYPYLIFMAIIVICARLPQEVLVLEGAIKYGAWTVLLASYALIVFQGGYFQLAGDISRFRGIAGGMSTLGGYAVLMSLYFSSRFLVYGERKMVLPALLFAAIVIMSVSRISIMGLIVGIGILCLLTKRWKILVVCCGLILIGAMSDAPLWWRMFYSRPQSWTKVVATASSKELLASINLQGRDTVWRESWERFSSQVLMGGGLETTGAYSAQRWGPGVIHNEYLRILLETGVVGFGLWLTSYLVVSVQLVNVLRNPVTSRSHWPVLALSALAFYAAFCFFDNGLDYFGPIAQYVWAFSALALAQFRALSSGSKQRMSSLAG